VIDWYADIYLDEYAWARYFVRRDGSRVKNPLFPGEAWCQGAACSISNLEITMNTISVRLQNDAPDRLVINQNYDKDFISEQGPVLEQDGLIAMDLPEVGSHDILNEFRPPHILRALRVSAVSLLIVLCLLALSYRSRKGETKTPR